MPVGVLHHVLPVAGVLGGGFHAVAGKLVMMGAQPYLEAEIIQRILHGLTVCGYPQIRVVLVPFRFRVGVKPVRVDKELMTDFVRRGKVLLAGAVHPAFEQALVVKHLFAAQLNVPAVVIKGQVALLGLVDGLGKHGHAKPGASGAVFKHCGPEQREPGHSAAGAKAPGHALRQRRGLVTGGLAVLRVTGKVLVCDAVPCRRELVGLQIDAALSAGCYLAGKGDVHHLTVADGDGQDALGGQIVHADLRSGGCHRLSALHR